MFKHSGTELVVLFIDLLQGWPWTITVQVAI